MRADMIFRQAEYMLMRSIRRRVKS